MQHPSYAEYPPPSDLRAAVACTWVARTGQGSGPSPIVPDACSDIVIVGEAAPHVAGPATTTQHVLVPPGTTVVGIRFRPGATRAAFGCDANELRDADPELAAVCGSAVHALADGIGRARDADDPARALRSALEAWVRTRIGPRIDGDANALRAARRLVLDRSVMVRDVARDFGWSERRLHREITATCGYGPKTLQRIVRLQRALRASRAGVATRPPTFAPTLSRLALDAGYADQAHMTREFRDLTGFTPRQLLGRSGADVGRWLED
ncbi:MAG: helix-turn-helix transcriptional regulator [Gemmatimonadetes bacterium]|nr:helix-turn-helix transcriptional regulator [Gemmatimonadota bacterium]